MSLKIEVLNLIINGIPSIPNNVNVLNDTQVEVLNLIINGIPSIQNLCSGYYIVKVSFKPYYKWNTFNTYG